MVCPCKLPADVWMDDPTQWPPLSYPDLYCITILSRYQVFILKKWKITKSLTSPQALFVWVGSKCGTCNIIIWKCFADV